MRLLMDKVIYKHAMGNKFDNSLHFAEVYKNLDGKILKKILCNFNYLRYKYNMYDDGIINNIIFDINEAISKSDLSDIQKHRLTMWMDGYTEQDIADTCGVSRWVVSKSIVASCERIAKILKGLR